MRLKAHAIGLIESGHAKYIEGKSTIGIFFVLFAGLVTVVGLIGKVLNFDKSIALWLSSAITVNPATKMPELKLWFLPVIFLILFVIVALALMIIRAIRHNYGHTEDQIALNDLMGAVRQIRDQAKQTRVKAWDSLTFIYLINKDLSGSLTRVSVMKSVDIPVHFWETVNTVEDEADEVKSLAAVNYRVRDLSSAQNNIVYLPSENGKRCKKACLFFLPPIQPGESRKFEISFQWPGLFRRLKENSEDIEFKSETREVLSSYRVELYLQQGSKSTLECEITGDQYLNQSLNSAKYESNGWTGHGYIYEVKNIPPGNLRLVLKARLQN